MDDAVASPSPRRIAVLAVSLAAAAASFAGERSSPTIDDILRAINERDRAGGEADASRAPATPPTRRAPERADAHLQRFDELIGEGAYDDARAYAARLAKGATDERRVDVLRCAARVATVLVERAALVRTAVARLTSKTCSFFTKAGPRKGEVVDVDDGGFGLRAKVVINGRAVGEHTYRVAWADLTDRQVSTLVPDWRAATPDAHIALGLVALGREDLEAVKKSLAVAPEHPLAGHLRDVLAARQAGFVEEAAAQAWAALEKRLAGKKPAPAQATQLLRQLEAFEEKYRDTRAVAGIRGRLDEIALRLKVAGRRVPTEGLVAHWPFDEKEGTTVRDMGPHKLDGTAYRFERAEGKLGGAIAFNGRDSFVEIGNPEPLRITGPMTVCAWVWAEPDIPNFSCIFGKPGWGKGWMLRFKGLHPSFGVGMKVVQTAKPVTASEWHHVLATYDGSVVTLYVDGVADPNTLPCNELSPYQSLKIGWDTYQQNRRWKGRIDEARIYGRVLTAEEITLLARQ